MRKLSHEKRRRQRKQPTKLAMTLMVEALEPRLVLSAAGFGFEGSRGQLDFHHQDHGHLDSMPPAFAEQLHSVGVDERFALANHFEFNSPMPGPHGHPRGGRPDESFLLNFFEQGLRKVPFEGQPRGRSNDFSGAEGESPRADYQAKDLSFYTPVDSLFESTPHAETSIPSLNVMFVLLTPLPTRGGELVQFGQSTTILTQPPRTSITTLVSQQSNSTGSLSVTSPVASPARIQVPLNAPSVAPPVVRFDSSIPDREASRVQSPGEPLSITNSGNETFVSFTVNELARWWDVDGESFGAAWDTIDQGSKSAQPSTGRETAAVPSNDSMQDRLVRLPAELLWTGVSEGGFIEIDTDAVNNSRPRFEFAEDSDDVANFKRPTTQTLRDAFWFDFGTARLEWMLDSPAIHALAEERVLDDAADADEEPWLLDDGGMIVLTSAQFIDQTDEVAVDDTRDWSSTGEPQSGEIDIPMDAGLGVFQAIEVAAAPVEHEDDAQAPKLSPASIEGEATADTDNAIPSAEQAARSADDEPSVPIRAASTPLLLAISAFLFRDRQNRKKAAEQKRKV